MSHAGNAGDAGGALRLTRWHSDVAEADGKQRTRKANFGRRRAGSAHCRPQVVPTVLAVGTAGRATGSGCRTVARSPSRSRSQPDQDQGRFNQRLQLLSSLLLQYLISAAGRNNKLNPRLWMGEIRTTPRLSFNRNSISLNMNRTATLGGAPCLSNALHQHSTEITRGLARFQASLVLS